MSFRPSFRLTSLAAGLLLAVTTTAQPVFDQPANATFKGEVVSRGENVVPGSTADVVGRGFVPGQKVSLLRGDSVLNAQPLPYRGFESVFARTLNFTFTAQDR